MEIYNAELGASSMTMSLGTKPKLLFLYQGFAILMGLASMVAALPVAALSFGCYGAAMLLGRVRPLRNAYEFLSRSYDGILERRGQNVLRDSRDTPALRLMVALSLTAVPIFVMQLVLGKPRLLLVIAFYLSLYGLKFQRFVRMFSASHIEAHRRQGYFSGKWDKVFGRYLEFYSGTGPDGARVSPPSREQRTRRHAQHHGLRSNQPARFPMVSLGQHLDGSGAGSLRVLQSTWR